MEQHIQQELVAGILNAIQEKAVRIVLYGSAARGTNTESSDIDIAIIMNGRLDEKMEEILSNFIVDMNLKYDKVFSVIDIELETFQKWEKVSPFYQNVNKEGIILWKAA